MVFYIGIICFLGITKYFSHLHCSNENNPADAFYVAHLPYFISHNINRPNLLWNELKSVVLSAVCWTLSVTTTKRVGQPKRYWTFEPYQICLLSRFSWYVLFAFLMRNLLDAVVFLLISNRASYFIALRRSKSFTSRFSKLKTKIAFVADNLWEKTSNDLVKSAGFCNCWLLCSWSCWWAQQRVKLQTALVSDKVSSEFHYWIWDFVHDLINILLHEFLND